MSSEGSRGRDWRRAGRTPDGSPVAIYRALPAEPEFTPLLEHLPRCATVLDLGCGVGRLANVLAERGHHVTGVDESPAMLRHVHPAVEQVQARIEELRLGRRFDAVVLPSHLVNTPDGNVRRSLLGTAAAHVEPAGKVYIEHYDPARRDKLVDTDGEAGPVRTELRISEKDGDWFRADVTYRLRDQSWTQRFEAVILDDDALEQEIRTAGLEPTARLTSTWLVTMPSAA